MTSLLPTLSHCGPYKKKKKTYCENGSRILIYVLVYIVEKPKKIFVRLNINSLIKLVIFVVVCCNPCLDTNKLLSFIKNYKKTQFKVERIIKNKGINFFT